MTDFHDFGLGDSKPTYQDMSDPKMIRDAILDAMLTCNQELYEKILDTPGFAFHFNNLSRIAGREEPLR